MSATVTRDVLDPAVVRKALELALLELEQPDGAAVAARLETLKTELARLDAELARYAEAIADAGSLDAILQAIKVRQLRRDALRTELKALATQRRAEPQNTSEIRATLEEYLKDWRAMRVRKSPRHAASCGRCSLTAWSSRSCRARRTCHHRRAPAESRVSSTSSGAKDHSRTFSQT